MNITTPEHTITIAQNDIPPHIDADHLAQWRKEIRIKLNISLNAIVYCYNGSAKPWQCPNETIAYFKTQRAKNLMQYF